MTQLEKDIQTIFLGLDPVLIEEIISGSVIKDLPGNTQIFREGQCVKTIPIVLTGLAKAYMVHEEKELLLHYIKPGEISTMLLTAGLNNEQSKVFVSTEENTTALFLPVSRIAKWMEQSPGLGMFFFRQYNMQYNDMLETIHNIAFDKMDDRLFRYLKNKVLVTNANPLRISHKQIAAELGTAREVVTRALKRLEDEGKVALTACTIKLLNSD